MTVIPTKNMSKNIGEYPWFKGKKEEFKYFERNIGGDDVVLIVPTETKAVGAPWYEDDKIYRSSIWRISDGKPVSLGYKKFVNYGENPAFEPVDIHDNITAIEKVDGTCLICSRYKGEYMFRTRATTDVHQMQNGNEVDALVEKYNVKKLMDDLGDDHTVIFEWVTPTNILCVKYDEPDLYLTGIVRHADYSYYKQDELDSIAERYGLKRPRHHTFNVDNADDMAAVIREEWTGVEGVVAYFGDEQQLLKKMKSNWHYHLHVARIMVGNKAKFVGHLWDLGAFEKFDADTFGDIVAKSFEYEVLEYYSKELNDIWCAFIVMNSIKSFVHAKVAEMGDAHEVVDAIRQGVFGNLKDTYVWSEFRNNAWKKSFFVSEMLNIMEAGEGNENN